MQNQASQRCVGAEKVSRRCAQAPGALYPEFRAPALSATVAMVVLLLRFSELLFMPVVSEYS